MDVDLRDLITAISPSVNVRKITEGVMNDKYSEVRKFLKEETILNIELYFGHVRVTGLEQCILRESWKMACIFLAHGADPRGNVFDGTIESHASYAGMEDPIIMEGFDGDNPIPGFDGLRLLAPDNHETQAFLSLIEFCKDPIVTFDDTVEVFSWITKVAPSLKHRLHTQLEVVALLCMRNSMPQEVSSTIVDLVAKTELWSFFTCEVVEEVCAAESG